MKGIEYHIGNVKRFLLKILILICLAWAVLGIFFVIDALLTGDWFFMMLWNIISWPILIIMWLTRKKR